MIAAIICIIIYYGTMMRGPSYENMNQITIYVTYMGQENFSPLESLVVATDPDFKNKLILKSAKFLPDNGLYAFIYDIDNIPDAVYIMKPCIYSLINDKTVSIPLKQGSVAELNGEDWLTIENITTTKIYTGVFQIAVSITASQNAVPSVKSLKIGDVILDEFVGETISKIEFDENANYLSETFCFKYNTGAKDDISELLSDSTLILDNIYSKVCNVEINATSDIDSINLIVK